MVDVTALEVGSQRISLSVLDGLYTIDRATGFYITLNSTQYVAPSLLQITSVTPPNPDDTYAGTFLLTGTGFDLVDPIGAFLWVVGPDTSLPIPETMVGFTPISATEWEAYPDIITTILNFYATAPYGFRFKLVPDIGSGLPTVYSPVIPVVPAVPVLSVTFAVPSTVDETQDPGFTIYGTEFDSTINLFVFTAPGPSAGIPVMAYMVISPTEIAIPPGSGLVPMFLSQATPPCTMMFRVEKGIEVAEGAPVNITAVVVPDPMSDAYFVPYAGSPGEVPLTVTGGPGPSLYVLRMADSALWETSLDMSSIPQPSPTENWTLCGWFRRQEFDGGLGQFGLVFVNPFCQTTFYNGSLESVIVSIGPSNTVDTSPLSLLANDYNWHHVAIVRDFGLTGEFRLYLDGVFIASVPIGPGDSRLYNATGSFTFGKSSLPVDPACQGTPAVWKRALNDLEIADIYNNTTFPP